MTEPDAAQLELDQDALETVEALSTITPKAWAQLDHATHDAKSIFGSSARLAQVRGYLERLMPLDQKDLVGDLIFATLTAETPAMQQAIATAPGSSSETWKGFDEKHGAYLRWAWRKENGRRDWSRLSWRSSTDTDTDERYLALEIERVDGKSLRLEMTEASAGRLLTRLTDSFSRQAPELSEEDLATLVGALNSLQEQSNSQSNG